MTEGRQGPADPSDPAGTVALRADSLFFSLAQTTDELLQSYRLVYRNYLRAEYIDPHPSGMRYSAYNALPSTVTFVAKLRETVVTTASVVFDSPLGLPMDDIYKDEVDELRSRGARLCEVTMLADRRRAGMRTIPSILQLFKLAFHYTFGREGMTDITITINPSHEGFYTRYLPFTDLAGLRYYPAVKDAPALAKRLRLPETIEKHKDHKLYDFFMGSPTPGEVLEAGKRFTAEELRELFVVTRDILPNLGNAKIDYIRGCYPDYDFEAILEPVKEK